MYFEALERDWSLEVKVWLLFSQADVSGSCLLSWKGVFCLALTIKKANKAIGKKKKTTNSCLFCFLQMNSCLLFSFLILYRYCKSFYVSSKVHFCVNTVLIFHTYSDLLVSLLSFVFLIARLYIFKEFFINLVPLNLAQSGRPSSSTSAILTCHNCKDTERKTICLEIVYMDVIF